MIIFTSIDNVPDIASIGKTFSCPRPNGVLWITFIKSDGYENMDDHGSWRYIFVNRMPAVMPLTSGGYSNPKQAASAWQDVENHLVGEAMTKESPDA